MLFHSWLVGGLGPHWQWLARSGWIGVDLFFVLSGYLIGGQLLGRMAQGQGIDLRAFWWRRAWRILPAYAVVLLLYLSVPALREAPGMEPWWKFATFTLNLSIHYPEKSAFSHAWSLCVEEHFYLLFPLIVLAASRLGRPRGTHLALALITLLVLGGIILRGLIWWHDQDAAGAGNWFIQDLYFPTWCRLDGLLAGVLLAAARCGWPARWQAWQARAPWFAASGVCGLAAYFLCCPDRSGLVANTLGWPWLSASLAALVFAAASPFWRWRAPLAGFLATVSYSLYLSHKAVIHLVQQHAGALITQGPVLTFVVYAIAALLAGVALHRLVEAPGLRLRQRWAVRDRPGRERQWT